MKVEVYLDVVCPWCYIGERRFERALMQSPASGDIEVVFRPFQLDPMAPSKAVPIRSYLEQRFGGSVDRMLSHVGSIAAAEGIAMDWDRMLSVNTRTAHELFLLAEREHGVDVQLALIERLFDLHFVRGGDVGDVAQLADEAVAVGMDRDRVVAYLQSGEGRRDVEAAFQQAVRRGVRAVPTFVIDDSSVIEGAQSVETFVRALAGQAD